mmetsp:Transcript_24474/g.48142  ORF Transcript_24474/g.48142 Transcript_24474/m.48142 type:complete len:269 (-) Transcript_24474:1440-2246(-)
MQKRVEADKVGVALQELQSSPKAQPGSVLDYVRTRFLRFHQRIRDTVSQVVVVATLVDYTVHLFLHPSPVLQNPDQSEDALVVSPPVLLTRLLFFDLLLLFSGRVDVWDRASAVQRGFRQFGRERGDRWVIFIAITSSSSSSSRSSRSRHGVVLCLRPRHCYTACPIICCSCMARQVVPFPCFSDAGVLLVKVAPACSSSSSTCSSPCCSCCCCCSAKGARGSRQQSGSHPQRFLSPFCAACAALLLDRDVQRAAVVLHQARDNQPHR